MAFKQNEVKTARIIYETVCGSSGKWDLFLKKSSDTIQQAISNNNFIRLDPEWWTGEGCSNISTDYDFWDSGDTAPDGSNPSAGDDLSTTGWTQVSGEILYSDYNVYYGNLSINFTTTAEIIYRYYWNTGGVSDGTVDFWFYDDGADTANFYTLISLRDATSAMNYFPITSNTSCGSNYSYRVYAGAFSCFTTDPVSTRSVGWHHYMGHWDEGRMNSSIDGVQVIPTDLTFVRTAPTGFEIYTTAYVGTEYFMDDWRAYNGSSCPAGPDTTPPIFSNNLTDKIPKINENVTMNMTVSDDNPDSYKFAWNITGTFENISNSTYTLTVQNLSTSRNVTLTRDNYICWMYWANDTAGNENTSNEYCFTVENTKPDAPILLKPDNGSGSGTEIPEFNWTNSNDVDSDTINYTLEIYNSSELSLSNRTYYNSSIPEETNVTGVTPTNIIADNTFYWRVKAFDGEANSEWSSTWTFQYANWSITFNITSAEDGTDLGTVFVTCTNGWDSSSFPAGKLDSGDTAEDAFTPGTHNCTFSKTDVDYYSETVTFTADSDKPIYVVMSKIGALTEEEHTWLEALYNCIILKDCDLYDLLLEINQTVGNTWQHVKPTDESVITTETEISTTLNSTSNITYEYTVNIPIKAGYSSGVYLPVRVGYWFMNETNESCYNQGTLPTGITVIEPYCNPLMVETLGPMDGSVSFRVDLRPNLTAGTYNVKRIIEIDPNDKWIGYGQELIGQITVTEDMSNPGNINLEKTGETMPDTDSSSSSDSSGSSGGGGGSRSITNIINIYNITNIIKESEEKGGKEKAEGEERTPSQEETKSKGKGLTGITGAVINLLPKASLLIGRLITIIIVLGGLASYFFITKKK